MESRFNLIDEPWIPVADVGRVSLAELFTRPDHRALGGTPVQKIAVLKLLLAIAQAAFTPDDDDGWRQLSTVDLASGCLNYLRKWHNRFYLYGQAPFLQLPAISRAECKSYGTVSPEISTGNTTVLTQSQQQRALDDAEKALLLLVQMGFALGGKKTDNSVVLSLGYRGKHNDKSKPSTGKPGPSVSFLGLLHNFVFGQNLQQTLRLNLLTHQDVAKSQLYPGGVGRPPWEVMPEGEDCAVARRQKTTLQGRLVPLSRFCLLATDGLHYSEGIAHPDYRAGGIDPTIAVDRRGAYPKVLWANPDRRPWRELAALLSFLDAGQRGFECLQLRAATERASRHYEAFAIWSGGLRISSNAGEQYASGDDDYVDSTVWLQSADLNSCMFARLRHEIDSLNDLASRVYGCVTGYCKSQQVDAKATAAQAAQATSIFWQLCERDAQTLIDSCGAAEDKTCRRHQLRRRFAANLHLVFDRQCPDRTVRQLDAWAKYRPHLSHYLQREGLMNEETPAAGGEPDRVAQFIGHVVMRCNEDKGVAARLRRADNPATEYQSWEILGSFGISLESHQPRLAYQVVAASIARARIRTPGSLMLGRAIAACFPEGRDSDQGRARLRRLLSCNDAGEVCRILRTQLMLIDHKTMAALDYARLLKQLLHFGRDAQRIKAQWAQEFYGQPAEEA